MSAEAMPLWDWAVAGYQRPSVPPICLHLQDDFGQNVPLLLWAIWAGQAGWTGDEETLEAACDLARAWDDLAVRPLRAVRQAMKKPHPDLDDLAREQVRDQVKAVELMAEKALLEGLEALEWSEGPSGRRVPAVVDTVARLAKAWSGQAPRAALTQLVDALSS
ncbi:MAG: TIGR02444 family protein [Asticcacaulis sp.]